MKYTIQQYDEAIDFIALAKQQLTPDGNSCSICSDIGHQAWECPHNPLVAMDYMFGFRCFYCGGLFFGEAATEHFGKHKSIIEDEENDLFNMHG